MTISLYRPIGSETPSICYSYEQYEMESSCLMAVFHRVASVVHYDQLDETTSYLKDLSTSFLSVWMVDNGYIAVPDVSINGAQQYSATSHRVISLPEFCWILAVYLSITQRGQSLVISFGKRRTLIVVLKSGLRFEVLCHGEQFKDGEIVFFFNVGELVQVT
ncbi:hypothetical protein NHQ30_010082 [Ciborinia camelliae]|nr:hypothetical protein NHQ30_010082 [Ciborinia camelliae]